MDKSKNRKCKKLPATLMPVFHMTSWALPWGMWRHFADETRPGVVVIDKGAGEGGLSRLLGLAFPHKRRLPDAVVVLDMIKPQNMALVRAVFTEVADATEFRYLPAQDLVAALKAQDRRDRAVGVAFSPESGVLTFLTGDMRRLVVPVSITVMRRAVSTHDINAVKLIDGGKTVFFVLNHEIPFSDIRAACDPLYKRATRKQARAQDQSFGASLRRARVHRGLGQEELGVTGRTIRNIETGKIGEDAIHDATRKSIEQALGMTFRRIRTY